MPSQINCPSCQSLVSINARFCERCGAKIKAISYDPLIGRTLLGQYVIKEKLGEGGFGAVYLADQPLMQRQIAIKTLHRHLASNESQMLRFRREGTPLCGQGL
jgi:serine/threonine protein kinase